MESITKALDDSGHPAHEAARNVWENGPYEGIPTRQGYYVLTAGGEVLAASKANNPDAVIETMREGRRAWEAMAPAGRGSPRPASPHPDYPGDGLVLRVDKRVLGGGEQATPEAPAPDTGARNGPFAVRLLQRYAVAETNQDFIWYRRDEAEAFAPPADARAGDRYAVEPAVVRRILRFHLTDPVRTVGEPYPPEAIESDRLEAAVTGVRGDRVTIRFEGTWRASQTDLPRLTRFERSGERRAPIPRHPERGYATRVLGRAVWDESAGQFAAFEIVGLAAHWGGPALRPARKEDPLGFVIRLAGDRPVDRVPPDLIDYYEWAGDQGVRSSETPRARPIPARGDAPGTSVFPKASPGETVEKGWNEKL